MAISRGGAYAFAVTLCLTVALGTWSCDQGGGAAPTPTGPSVGVAAASSNAPVTSNKGPGPTPAPGKPPADQTVIDALTLAIQDEHHAVWAYQYVLATIGSVQPFTHIELAELHHVDAIQKLFDKYSLTEPENAWGEDDLWELEDIDTLLEACQAGVAAENDNIAMYDTLLALELPKDVKNVFTNLRSASLNNHLPAFEKCVTKAK